MNEEDGAVIVTFPAAPDWLWAFQVGMAGALGFGYFAMAAKVARFIYRWAPPGTAATPQTLAPMAVSALWIMLPGVVWWAIAGYAWWSRRRGAGTSRVLIATRERLTLRRFAWTGIRDTIWRADSIDRIELKILTNPGRKKTVARLHVRFRARTLQFLGLPLIFRLSTTDRDLPMRLASGIAETLHTPLKFI